MKKILVITVWIAWIFFFILSTIFIAQLILKITGHSPSAIEMLNVGQGIIISYLFGASLSFGMFREEAKKFRRNVKESFKRIKQDIETIRSKVSKT